MAIQRVSDMTLNELNRMIDHAIDRRLQGLLKPQSSHSHAELLEDRDA